MNRITRTLMLFVACFLAAQMSAQTSDRSKAHGYQFSEEELERYPQKTDVPTVYLEVYKTTVVDGKAQPIAEGETPELEDLNTVFGTKNDWYYNAQIIIRDDNGTIEERKEPTTVRGRGNATWDISANSDGLLKKPLRLKFPQKTALLGSDYATEKSWTLLANHYDATLIRNAMANVIGNKVGLAFCPAYKFVDLIVNGTYMGTYQISDQVQVAEKRVPINEETGYFVEGITMNRDGFLEDPYLALSYTDGWMNVNIKSPDPDIETANGVTQDPKYADLKTHLEKIANLANNGPYNQPENWRKYVDITSAVNAFIAEDITGNYDGCVGNNYAYMNDLESKLFFGPLWDFDLAWGGKVNSTDMTDMHFWRSYTDNFGGLCSKVYNDPYFVKVLYERWLEVYDNGNLVSFLQGKADEIKNSIAASVTLNYASKNNGGAGESINKPDWADANNYADLEATYTVMKTFIAEHIAWLNTEYKNQYDALGCENLAEIPDEVAEGQKGFIFLGQNAYFNSNYGEYAYKFVGTERNMVEGAKLTITGDVTNIDSYVGSIMRWDDKKEITLTADDVSALAANNYTIDIVSWGGTISSVEITCSHYYTDCQYTKQVDGTYRQVCTDCGKVDNDNVIYKFTVYPESAVSTELYAKSWEPTNENPNSIAMISVTADDAPNGTNIVNNGTCANFVLTDGHPFYCPSKFTATQATYSRLVTNDWGTIVLPFKYQQASNETVSFYHLKEVSTAGDDKQLVLTPIDPTQDGNASAYTPVFFKRADESVDEITVTGSNVKVKASTEPMSRTTGDWTLKGAMTETLKIDVQDGTWSGKNIYYISNNQFWHATGKVNIKPFRAYLESTQAVSSAIGLMVDDGETTGIMSIENGELIIDSEADAWYSLDGRLLPVRPTSKGIYIHNGRKEVIR